MKTTPASAGATRPAGRPSKFKGEGKRRSLWVDSASWDAAATKAAEEGRPSLSDALQELITAYGEGRVTIRRARGTKAGA